MSRKVVKWDSDDHYSYEKQPRYVESTVVSADQNRQTGSNTNASNTQTVARVGAMTVVTKVSEDQFGTYERSWKSHDRDRQTGNYRTISKKETASEGQTFKERSTGRVGSKDEFKSTSTFRVGDRTGYSEYQYEERYRRVDYGNESSGSGGKGKGKGNSYTTSKKYLE